jgi:quaternary ammonium compound-resistance protein SugE
MNWLFLIAAGLCEVGFTTCLNKAKEASGAAATWWLMGFLVSLLLSMYLLYKAIQTIPLGTAYAVWTGIGAAGTALIGILFFKEPAAFWRLFFIFTLIASVVGLKFN